MKVVASRSFFGDGIDAKKGNTYEVSDKVAKAWIADGFVEEVKNSSTSKPSADDAEVPTLELLDAPSVDEVEDEDDDEDQDDEEVTTPPKTETEPKTTTAPKAPVAPNAPATQPTEPKAPTEPVAPVTKPVEPKTPTAPVAPQNNTNSNNTQKASK